MSELGAIHEGIARQDRFTWTGRIRDTAVYSILSDEWPAVRYRLDDRLHCSRGNGRATIAWRLPHNRTRRRDLIATDRKIVSGACRSRPDRLAAMSESVLLVILLGGMQPR